MGSQQLYSLSWGEFGSSLTSTVQILRNHNEMVDVTLAAGGRIFPAHKLVLSAASPLLMQLLKSTHCHHPVLMLAGITAPDLEALLQFVYQGEVSVDSTQLPSLLQAAHCLDIQALSPQTLTTEKTMAQVSAPPVMTDNVREMNVQTISSSRDLNMTPQPQTSRDLAPLMPVRKRKRKQSQSSETESMKWGISDGAVVTTVEAQQLEQVSDSHSEDTKEGIMDEQHSNSETVKKLVSDLPVECTVCGVTLRQSRNLRRHMELIHLKAESGGVKLRKGQPLVKDETKKVEEEGVHGVQTMTEQPAVEQCAVTSRLPVQPPPPSTTHLLTSPPTTLLTSSSTKHLQTLPSPTTHLVTSSSTTHLLTSPPTTLLTSLCTTHLLKSPPTTHLLTSSSTTHLTSPHSSHVHNPPLMTHLLTSSPTTHLTSPHSSHLHNPPPTTHLLTSPPMYHSSVQCDPYPLTQTTHSHAQTHSMQYTHEMYRHQHSDILRGAGLYTNTREHCAPE